MHNPESPRKIESTNKEKQLALLGKAECCEKISERFQILYDIYSQYKAQLISPEYTNCFVSFCKDSAGWRYLIIMLAGRNDYRVLIIFRALFMRNINSEKSSLTLLLELFHSLDTLVFNLQDNLDFQYHMTQLLSLNSELLPRYSLEELLKKHSIHILENIVLDNLLTVAEKIAIYLRILTANLLKKIPHLLYKISGQLIDFIEERRNTSSIFPDEKIEENLTPYFDLAQNCLNHSASKFPDRQEQIALSLARPHLASNHLHHSMHYLQMIPESKKASVELALLLFRLNAAFLPTSFREIANKNALILLLLSCGEQYFAKKDYIFLLQAFHMLKNNSVTELNLHKSLKECLGVTKVISFKKLVEIVELSVKALDLKTLPSVKDEAPLAELIKHARAGFTPTIAAQLITHSWMRNKLLIYPDVQTDDVTTFEDLIVRPTCYPITSTADLLLPVVNTHPERLNLIKLFWQEYPSLVREMQQPLLQAILISIRTAYTNYNKPKANTEDNYLATFTTLFRPNPHGSTGKSNAKSFLDKCAHIDTINILIEFITTHLQQGPGNFKPESFKTLLMRQLTADLKLDLMIPQQEDIKSFCEKFCEKLAQIISEIPEPQLPALSEKPQKQTNTPSDQGIIEKPAQEKNVESDTPTSPYQAR